MIEFIKTFYIDPIYQGTGYNLINTSTYAILLIVGFILIYKLLKRFEIKIDEKFFIGIIPFIIFGGVLRSFEDFLEATGGNEIFLKSFLSSFLIITETGVRNILLVTPPIYLTIFFITGIALSISVVFSKIFKISYHKIWFSIGSLLTMITFFQLKLIDFTAVFLMLGISGAWIFLLFVAKKYIKNEKVQKTLTNENTFILSAHMFDASTTFVALQFYDYFEQHVLPGFLINIFGPGIMFFLKLIIVSLVLYHTDKDGEEKNLIKIVILILGLGPGLRNFLRLAMGV